MGLLDGRVAFITGGASGIGEATARKFAGEGASVVLADINTENASRICDELSAAGASAAFEYCDVSEADSVGEAVRKTVERFTRIDIVFANAGINGIFAPVDDLKPEEWGRTMAINLTGTYLTVHFTVPHLRNAGGGSIIITSSVNGNRSFAYPGASAYCTSKAGQVAFMKMMALELGRDHIRCNAICPGAIPTNIDKSTHARNTDRIAMPMHLPKGHPALNQGWGYPNDVADACLYLASDMRRHISGVVIYVDGGASLLR